MELKIDIRKKKLSNNEKYGAILLIIGIPILAYLSFTLLAGTTVIMNHYESYYIDQYWDQINYLLFNFILNIILLVTCLIAFIIPGAFLIKKRKGILKDD